MDGLSTRDPHGCSCEAGPVDRPASSWGRPGGAWKTLSRRATSGSGGVSPHAARERAEALFSSQDGTAEVARSVWANRARAGRSSSSNSTLFRMRAPSIHVAAREHVSPEAPSSSSPMKLTSIGLLAWPARSLVQRAQASAQSLNIDIDATFGTHAVQHHTSSTAGVWNQVLATAVSAPSWTSAASRPARR